MDFDWAYNKADFQADLERCPVCKGNALAHTKSGRVCCTNPACTSRINEFPYWLPSKEWPKWCEAYHIPQNKAGVKTETIHYEHVSARCHVDLGGFSASSFLYDDKLQEVINRVARDMADGILNGQSQEGADDQSRQ
jgi:hypothetical protein